jgi:protein ImuB
MKMRQRQAQHKKPWWEATKKAEADKKYEQTETEQAPLVLVQNNAKGTCITAVGPDGQREGIWPGMKLTDARAMMPNLRVLPHDTQADHFAFTKLAHWMLRYSPSVSIHRDDGFVLDITGCAHLFGGEKSMAQDIEARLSKIGFTSHIAIANTFGACFALAHHGASVLHILPQENGIEALDILPVEALRLDDATIMLLKRLGLKRIGDVSHLPRAALERRFRDNKKSESKTKISGLAQSVQWRLDQLSGALAEPLDFIVEPQSFRSRRPCPALALEQGAIAIALEELLPKLCAQLKAAGKGARRFCLTGYRADGGAGSVCASLSQPVNKPESIWRLFKDRLDYIDCGFGIDLFVLEASGVEAMHASQHDMVAQEQALSAPSIAAFADIVTNRFGPKTVNRLAPCTSHVPERAQRLATVNTQIKWEDWKALEPSWAPRPTRLFMRPEPAQVTAELPDSPPVQFIWRKVLRKVTRSRGPERILPEWWHDNLKTKSSAAYRDYYDIEDERGQRYWIFRATKKQAIVASDNDNGDAEPKTMLTTSWFVHGLY